MASESLSRGIYAILIINIDPIERWKRADSEPAAYAVVSEMPVSLTRTLFGCPLVTRLPNNINLSESPKYGAFSTYCRFNSCSHFHCISRIICAVLRSLSRFGYCFSPTQLYIYIHPAPWMLYLFCLGIIKGPWWAHIDGDTKYSWTEKAKTDGWLYGIWCRCLFEMSSHRFYVDIVVVVVVLVVVATIDSIVIIIILATIKLNESTKKGEPNSEVHFILFRTAETREIKNDGKNNRFAREQKPGNNLCPLFRIGCCDATAVDGTPLSPE